MVEALALTCASTHCSPSASNTACEFSMSEQPLRRNLQRFRGGLVFKAHRRVYHSTLGLRVIKKKKNTAWEQGQGSGVRV